MKNTTNQPTANIQNWTASIYQLDKEQNTTFESITKGTLENIDFEAIAIHLSNRLFNIVKAQANIHVKGGKANFFSLAKTKKMYFFFEVDGVKILDTELNESIRVRLSNIEDSKTLEVILYEVMNIFSNTNNIVL